MIETDEIEDVDELLFIAQTVSDKLEVIAHSQRLNFMGLFLGFYAVLGALAGFGVITFVGYRLNTRFSDELYQVSPILFMFSIYAAAVIGRSYYRLSIDSKYVSLARRRVDDAIEDARAYMAST